MNHSGTDSQLSGKRVLMLAPSFFNYEIEIKNQIEKLGANVTYINDDPSHLFLAIKGLIRRMKVETKWMVTLFERHIERRIKDEKYDFIFVICGWAVTSLLSKNLRNNHLRVDGKMVLYYWDSLALLGDDIKRWDYYDQIYTFDKKDYLDNSDRMKFLPLFYVDSYSKESPLIEKEIDLFSIGSFKFNRYFNIEKIKTVNPTIRVCSYMFDRRWLITLHKIFRPKYKHIELDNLKFKKLSAEEIVSYYNKSNAILDIPMAGQIGLTMRTFECLAMRKKMVTTNKNVKEYDFYRSENIYVMDSESCVLPDKYWFQHEYVAIPQDIYKKYSIDSWINYIFFYE